MSEKIDKKPITTITQGLGAMDKLATEGSKKSASNQSRRHLEDLPLGITNALYKKQNGKTYRLAVDESGNPKAPQQGGTQLQPPPGTPIQLRPIFNNIPIPKETVVIDGLLYEVSNQLFTDDMASKISNRILGAIKDVAILPENGMGVVLREDAVMSMPLKFVEGKLVPDTAALVKQGLTLNDMIDYVVQDEKGNKMIIRDMSEVMGLDEGEAYYQVKDGEVTTDRFVHSTITNSFVKVKDEKLGFLERIMLASFMIADAIDAALDISADKTEAAAALTDRITQAMAALNAWRSKTGGNSTELPKEVTSVFNELGLPIPNIAHENDDAQSRQKSIDGMLSNLQMKQTSIQNMNQQDMIKSKAQLDKKEQAISFMMKVLSKIMDHLKQIINEIR